MLHRHLQAASVVLLSCITCSLSASHLFADDATIVTFGDSTTAPRGKLTVYSDLLVRELPTAARKVQVINAGIGGNNTDMARKRFEKDVLAHDPDVVIIQFGINDAAVDVWKSPPATQPRVDLDRYRENLKHFITTLRARGTHVILMTPNPLRWTPSLKQRYGRPPYDPDDEDGFNLLLREYAAAARRVADQHDVPLVDVDRAFHDYDRQPGQSLADLLLDGMHPNERGQRMIADLLIKELQSDTDD
ncbi:putative rhamnogalacturonan acetylesterase YesY [Maioricimonas rarisocia]|uniref:Putative rhamnogalacturonan acetylesterase YesY n=1 Tax=Maioricimonas rarisocia TaxID=2528026 RepID=A0A517Z0X9_9PLAN|nr:SGNH/GDSL hydrolase family protein [Maioricimonas rarisocia]QDU36131.1 putative rhamnogalacturonan acetylesterase YesY [Maioricimonas rarisocia]